MAKRFSLLEKWLLSKEERKDIRKYAPTRAEAVKWGLIPKKRYRVTNILYRTSKVISATDSDEAKRKVLKGYKSPAYSHKVLMKNLSARQMPKRRQ
jgi:hypothetical protein